MMFAVPAEPYEVDADVVDALNLLLILHADHEQNCSTSTVRLVGSSNANLYGSISCRHLRPVGPAARRRQPGGHGDAPRRAGHAASTTRSSWRSVKSGKSDRRLMGFGHRVYKNHDPRATILKKMADKLLAQARHQRPAARGGQGHRGSRSLGRLLHLPQALPQRRFLQRHSSTRQSASPRRCSR